jgi:hypothetical protein
VAAQPDSGPGQGEGPARDPRLPGNISGLRPGDFARGGAGDTCPPGAALGMVLDELSGPDRRCHGATDDEVIGLLGGWTGHESWALAAKLAIVAELIRRRPLPDRDGTPAPGPGGMPGCWDQTLGHEIAVALSISQGAADRLLGLAWTLHARLPRIGRALADGIIDYGKAKVIADETGILDNTQATAAEDLIIAAGLAGKTWTKLQRQAADAVCTIDPDGTRKRRERAQRDDARVRLWRETSGTCALAAHGLPPDEALAASASIDQRAQEYREAGLKHGIDLLRVMAYADLINAIPAHDRITRARNAQNESNAAPDNDSNDASDSNQGNSDDHGPDDSGPGDGGSDDDGPDDDGPNHDGPDHDGPNHDGPDGPGPGRGDGDGPDDGDGSGDGSDNDGPDGERDNDDLRPDAEAGAGPGPGGGPADGGDDGDPEHGGSGDPGNGSTRPDRPAKATLANLTIPLRTLLGLAGPPGSAHLLGPLDPDLARKLAAAAARSPSSEWCITITDNHGYAIAHGCARPARGKPPPGLPPASPATQAALPARVHLTVRLSDLHGLTNMLSRPAGRPWSFIPHGAPGSPVEAGQAIRASQADRAIKADHPGPPREPGPVSVDGTWTLALPGGRHLTVKLHPIAVTECDHRHESRSYKPSALLRHLVQVRDGECTFPPCTRHARETDFEHAIPYNQGGRTCMCNAGARSRRCHQVKQSPGWNVTQPRPAWHQWTTPTGRTYTQAPMQYPALHQTPDTRHQRPEIPAPEYNALRQRQLSCLL